MSDYIKRDAFIEDTVRKHCNDCEKRKNANGKTVYAIGEAPCRACELADLIDETENYPAADVRENARGKWIRGSRSDRCSVCGYETGRYAEGLNFCPNCGADVREVKTDE